MRDFIAAIACSLAMFTMGTVVGFSCTPPAEVVAVTETVIKETPGPEVLVEVPIEVLVTDPAEAVEIGRLTEELAAAKAESEKNLDGWRKTYALWLKLKCQNQ